MERCASQRRTSFQLRCVIAPCAWYLTTRRNIRRNGRRSTRLRARSAARERGCAAGCGGPIATRVCGPVPQRMTAIGSRRWSARTGNCATPTRSCARRRRILPRRSSTARSNDDRLHRRSSWGIWGRADLPRAADRPSHLPHARCPARRPAKLPARSRRDLVLAAEIRRVFEANLRVYGVRKVWRQLGREGIRAARCTVARLMRQMGLKGAVRGREVRTTVSNPAVACPLDRVNRQFRAPRPNVLWLSDFTYVATWQGFVYVAFVIDAYARRIVGWRVSRAAQAGFVLDALEQALADRRPVQGGGLVHQ